MILAGLIKIITPQTELGKGIAELLLLGVGVIGLSIASRWVPEEFRKIVAIGPIFVGFFIGMFLVMRLLTLVADDDSKSGKS
jgi:hypothetical protein